MRYFIKFTLLITIVSPCVGMLNYAQFVDDEAFQATRLPKPLQHMVKEYAGIGTSLEFFTAFTTKQIIETPDINTLVMTNDYCATVAINDPSIIDIWDIKTGECRQRLTQEEPVENVLIMPQGLLISTTPARVHRPITIYVWDPLTGKQLQTIRIITQILIAWNDQIVTAKGRTLYFFDPISGTCVNKVTIEVAATEGSLEELIVLPNKHLLVLFSSGNFFLWHPEKELRSLKTPSGNYGDAYVYDPNNKTQVKIQKGPRYYSESFIRLSIFSHQDDAYAELPRLSTEKLIMLRKLIEQFAKKPGLRTGDTLINFQSLPPIIQKCLASNYTITTEPATGRGACIVS